MTAQDERMQGNGEGEGEGEFAKLSK